MEGFFIQISNLGSGIPKDQETKLKELLRENGMDIVGPPLKI
jgi:hypothetical protein